MVSGVVVDLSGRALFPSRIGRWAAGVNAAYIYTDGGVRARSDSDSALQCVRVVEGRPRPRQCHMHVWMH